jgi:hypothetical protein
MREINNENESNYLNDEAECDVLHQIYLDDKKKEDEYWIAYFKLLENDKQLSKEAVEYLDNKYNNELDYE